MATDETPAEVWTTDLEYGYQQLRKMRNGVPFADPNMEEAYQEVQRRRSHTPPSEELAELARREQRGL
jgi:hypothetical protein